MVSKATKDFKSVWDNCLAIIKDNISDIQYSTWFMPIVPISIENATLTLEIPSHDYFDRLESTYINLLRTVIRKELGPTGKLQYKVMIEKNNSGSQNASFNLPSSSQQVSITNRPQNPPIDIYNTAGEEMLNPFIMPGIQKHKIHSNLCTTQTFDNFVEGDCNNLARSAGWAIANKPTANNFNPLFIYSETGLGKTHLVNAIGVQTKINHPDKTVLYVTSDLFFQQFIESKKNNNSNDFILFYQSVDVLIIDDIQFLAGTKPATHQAFFHIFNYFIQKGKQLIITSDKSPVDLQGFEARILSRFKWGLVADLQTPDLETRIAIVKKHLEVEGVVFPDEVIDYLALRISSSVRELKGAMIAILTQASLNKKSITVELAKEMVDKYVKCNNKEISIEFIQKAVSEYFGITVEKINTNKRDRDIVQPRQICMYFAKKMTDLPLSAIGQACGGKYHATVLHACNTISNLYDTDKKMKEDIDAIEKKLHL